MRCNPVRLTFEDVDDDRRVVVEWLLSSVCNYDCSYCPVYLHDSRVRWAAYDDIVAFCSRVRNHYRDACLTYLLTGGEITLYPKFGRLTADLKALDADVAILTNGSRPLSWWRANGGYLDEVIISYHHESADDNHLIAVAEMLAPRSRVQFNVVINPVCFDRTMAFAARAEAQTQARVNRKILFQDGWKRPVTYPDGQRHRLDAALAGEDGRASVLKGNLVFEYENGARRTVTALQLINNDLNHWPDWECAIGAQTLFVRFDEVWRAACRVGGPIGNIYDPDITLPVSGVRCTALSCNCIAGIKARKTRPVPR
jgi:organic radical activating enzyme